MTVGIARLSRGRPAPAPSACGHHARWPALWGRDPSPDVRRSDCGKQHSIRLAASGRGRTVATLLGSSAPRPPPTRSP